VDASAKIFAPPPDQTPKDGGRQTSGDQSGGGVRLFFGLAGMCQAFERPMQGAMVRKI
jgi:hypothetical protein